MTVHKSQSEGKKVSPTKGGLIAPSWDALPLAKVSLFSKEKRQEGPKLYDSNQTRKGGEREKNVVKPAAPGNFKASGSLGPKG